MHFHGNKPKNFEDKSWSRQKSEFSLFLANFSKFSNSTSKSEIYRMSDTIWIFYHIGLSKFEPKISQKLIKTENFHKIKAVPINNMIVGY